MENKKIKIISDGTPKGTTVTLSDGTKIPLVQSISFVTNVNSPYASCFLEILGTELELEMLQKNTQFSGKVIQF